MKETSLFFRIARKPPAFFGYTYLILIPAFSLIYFNFCAFTTNGSEEPITITLADSFYVSTVALTTLGTDEIIPSGELSKIILALESILGILILGLFLNSIALEISQDIDKKNKNNLEKEQSVIKNHINKLIHSLVDKSIKELITTESTPNYKIYVCYGEDVLTSRDYKRISFKSKQSLIEGKELHQENINKLIDNYKSYSSEIITTVETILNLYSSLMDFNVLSTILPLLAAAKDTQLTLINLSESKKSKSTYNTFEIYLDCIKLFESKLRESHKVMCAVATSVKVSGEFLVEYNEKIYGQ